MNTRGNYEPNAMDTPTCAYETDRGNQPTDVYISMGDTGMEPKMKTSEEWCEEELARVTAERDRLRKERDHYKKYLTILDTWDFSGRMGKREMKNLVRRTLQESPNE